MNISLNKELKSKIIIGALILTLSILYVSLFSYTTSILYPNYYGCDQAEFMTIGKMWSLGRLPYVTIFDHKGPIIFFINMLGLIIGGGSKVGIGIIQIIFMFFTILALYKISRLVSDNKLYAFILITITLLASLQNYNEGDTVEEYCVPFLCWSLYGLMKWYKNQGNHSAKWALLYGITFGFCIFTRATNIAPIAGLIFIVFCYLVKNRCWKNILDNIAYFVCGTLIVTLPFIIYFLYHGALYDLFYGTFLHNAKYFNNSTPWLITDGSEGLSSFFKCYLGYYVIFIILLIRLVKKDILLALGYAVTAIVETYVFMNGLYSNHYTFVCFGYIAIFINELYELLQEKETTNILLSIILISFLVTYVYQYNICTSLTKPIDMRIANGEIKERAWSELYKQVPNDELESFVFYGRAELAEGYLVTNATAYYKYAFIQDWYASYSDSVANEIRDLYNSEDAPSWIISDTGTMLIDDILANRYEIVDQNDKYVLWHLAL